MSQKVDSNEKSFTADGAIGQYLLVSKTATGVAACGIDDNPIGSATREGFAAGDSISVKLSSGAGTQGERQYDRVSYPPGRRARSSQMLLRRGQRFRFGDGAEGPRTRSQTRAHLHNQASSGPAETGLQGNGSAGRRSTGRFKSHADC